MKKTLSPLKPAAFLSYAHLDEDAEPGRIISLARLLEGKVTLHLGMPFRIFVDRRDIKWGERWPQTIEETLNEVFFLIPILTPAYFSSRMCKKEYGHFLERERELRRMDLILPIYYVKTDQLERARWTSRSTWAANIARRQYFDWRVLRLHPFDNVNVVRVIEKMAEEIRLALRGNKLPTLQEEDIMDNHEVNVKRGTAEDIDKSFRELTNTQRNIVYAFYTLIHPPEIPVDDLFDVLKRKYASEIEITSATELFYRIKDLSHLGFLTMRAKGKKTTIICGVPRVAKILHERHHLKT